MSHVFHPSQPTPEWVAQADPVSGLIAFRVGELDIFAALNPGQAQGLAVERFGAAPGTVRPISAEVLDRQVVNESGPFRGTLRQWLATQQAPGWLGRGVWEQVDFTGDVPLPDLLGDVPAPVPLRAFWVGDMDVFAASSAEAALAVARRPDDEFDALELDDVSEVTAEDLDKPMVEEDGTPCGTLRELLAEATEPGWLMGFE